MVDEVLARDTPSGGVAWYLPDRLGTVRDIIDNSGTVLDHIAYDAYGNILSQSNASGRGSVWVRGVVARRRHRPGPLGDAALRCRGRPMGGAGLERVRGRRRQPLPLRWQWTDECHRFERSERVSIGVSFIGGIGGGAIGGLITTGVIAVAGTVLAPAVVTVGSLTIAAVGTAVLIVDVAQKYNCGDWDGLAYDAGALLGGGWVGGKFGGRMPGSTPRGSERLGSRLDRQFKDVYNPNAEDGSLGKWAATGGNHEGYAGVIMIGGAGIASLPSAISGCK